MFKNIFILAVLALVIALPFIFREKPPAGDWRSGDPMLVIVSPHNEAIRYEFAVGFSKWYAAGHKRADGSPQPVKINWRSIGGTTEISRYLTAEFTNSARGWWERQGKTWPAAATDALTGKTPPTDPTLLAIWNGYRAVDSADQITSGIDLFFGGGEFDHSDLLGRGCTVPPWAAGAAPADLFSEVVGKSPATQSVEMIPPKMSGEIWRTQTLFGSAISTFGICSNLDRLKELGVAHPPAGWSDLADPIYFRQVGVVDPTKSGSIAKAFEMIIHQKIHERVIATGFDDGEIAATEQFIADKKWKSGDKAPAFPRIEVYQKAVESGWVDGLHLVQQIGANARYLTDSANKVPLDVSIGDAAVGISIDFFGRYQAQASVGPAGEVRMVYTAPVGGTSVSCDPVGLLRGAPHRAVAVEFITYVTSEDGQKLWTYKPGEPGGPEKFALRRLPIRRDFYPSTNPAIAAIAAENLKHAADRLDDPTVDPYALAKKFTYYPRWTGRHFGIQRDIIRAMCMDSADELKAAWSEIKDHGGPSKCLQAMTKLGELPTVTLPNADGTTSQVILTWDTAPGIPRAYKSLDYMREWTAAFRANYIAAKVLAAEGK